MLTHNNIIASERAYCATLNLNSTDIMLMPAPLAHATGFMHGVTAPFMMGARSVLLDIFNPEQCLEIIEREKCTCIMGQHRLRAICLRRCRPASAISLLCAFSVRRDHHSGQTGA
jgi:acyl-CoA synthetase